MISLLEFLLLADTKVNGRTRLQKMFYLLKDDLNKVSGTSDFKFFLHYYGPFSRELANELDRLYLEGLVDMRAEQLVDYDRYTISLTDQGLKKAKAAFEARPREERDALLALSKRLEELKLLALNDLISNAYDTAEKQGLR
jgi:uncharacterized protein YwgA